MHHFLTTLTQAIIAFTATNIDDIIILLLFFAQIDDNFRRRHIFIGQYLGFIAIIILSLPGFFGGLIIPKELIGLLGLLPIFIGIKQLINRAQENTEVQNTNIDILGSSHPNKIFSFLLSILHPKTYTVAAVTIANGGDNISIYIPLFAGQDFPGLAIISTVFFTMVAVWCAIAYLLSRQATIGYMLTHYGKNFVPFVLIGLGLLIMYERGSFTLILKN